MSTAGKPKSVMYVYPTYGADRLREQYGMSAWDAARISLPRFKVVRYLQVLEVEIVGRNGVVIDVIRPTGVSLNDGTPRMEGEHVDSDKIGKPTTRPRTSQNSVAFS